MIAYLILQFNAYTEQVCCVYASFEETKAKIMLKQYQDKNKVEMFYAMQIVEIEK